MFFRVVYGKFLFRWSHYEFLFRNIDILFSKIVSLRNSKRFPVWLLLSDLPSTLLSATSIKYAFADGYDMENPWRNLSYVSKIKIDLLEIKSF